MLWACRRLVIYLCVFSMGLGIVGIFLEKQIEKLDVIYIVADIVMLWYWIKHPIKKGK